MTDEKNWIIENNLIAQTAGESTFILLDSAHAPASHLKLEQWGVPYFSLFEGTPEESLKEIAPLLIPLAGLDEQTLKRLCTWALHLGYAHPCLNVIHSRMSGEALAASLQRYHVVGIDDGQSMLMRWYDTRILPVWMAALEPEQKAQFTAGISKWNYINRFGNPTPCYRSKTSSETIMPQPPIAMHSHIVLNNRQFALLVDATDVDTLVAHLRRIIPDETGKVGVKSLFEFVSEYQQMAIKAGVDDIDRQAQYLILALYTSGAGVRHPSCTTLMQSPPEKLDDFYAALQDLPEEAWQAGLPLWENPRLLAA